MTKNIEGKVVVITGASSGLGEATARFLSAQGASVVLGARRVERMQVLADELKNRGGKALAIKTDVTHREQVQALVDAAVVCLLLAILAACVRRIDEAGAPYSTPAGTPDLSQPRTVDNP